jgi:D-glycero-D-manno-heptose 1,7-bisphosphate phosphatase
MSDTNPHRPAIFFDRDNTLIVNDGYLGDPTGVVLVEGAADAVARARQLGYLVVSISNQSGVARGMFDESAVHAVNARMDEMLREANPEAVIDRHEYCPYHVEAEVEAYRRDSDLRKPKPGMLLRAAEALGIDLSKSWMIGDAPRDIEAGQAAGCRTILFRDAALAPSPDSVKCSVVQPDHSTTSLRQAIELIAGEPHGAPPAVASATESPAPVIVAAPPAPVDRLEMARLESLADQILTELRAQRQPAEPDFSVSRLLAGIVQIVALAALFVAYLYRDTGWLVAWLLMAIFLQILTASLLIMARQK